MEAGALRESLEEHRALADLESRFFGRAPRAITLSRYVLLDRLGAGGAGMVYRAYDPELDRRVAVKLLLSTVGEEVDERHLLHEAQAMARLSHPNVIAVHDVGTYREHDLGLEPGASPTRTEIPPRGIFVVMELVEGMDLGAWSTAVERSVDEVLEVFTAAGRGLVAAHEAGLVHRDFKPQNVRVGDDGRVCVLDFGLARASVVGPDARTEAGERTQGLVGTPTYMSPEQHRGERPDSRSDQYNFAVALYQGLYDTVPFAGSITEMARAKTEGKLPPPPSGRALSWRVRAVLERALRPRPQDRYPSMTALLADLQRARRRPRRYAVLAAIALFGGGVGTAVALVPPAEDPCVGGEQRVAQVWNESRKELVRAQLASTGAPYATTTAAAVERELDRYFGDWNRRHRDACEATHVRHEQSDAMLDLRMACLDRHLAEVEAVVSMLADADTTVAENAVVAVNALGGLGACEDIDALRWRVDLPNEVGVRARVEELYAALARGRAAELAGRYDEALAEAQSVAEQAGALDYPPLVAAANLRRGAALQGKGDFAAAEQALLEAIWAAEASRDETVATDAWIRLVWVVGVEQGRTEEGHRWARFAESALQRRGSDPLRQATLDHNRAGVFYREGRHADALAGYTRALEVQTSLLGEDDPTVARTLNHIGNTLIMSKRLDESFVYCQRSLEIRRETLGEHHPLVAASLNNLASVRKGQGELEQARSYAERAADITAGSGSPEEMVSLVLAGDILEDLGQPEAARSYLQRLLDIRRAARGLDHPSVRALEARIERLSPPDPAPGTAEPG